MSFRKAAARLGCTLADIKALVLAGELPCINQGHDPDRILMTTSVVSVDAVERVALKRGIVRKTPGANYTLGDHPGCGACLKICSVCRQVEKRCKSDLLTEEEAVHILGCTRSELAGYVRRKRIRVSSNTKWRYYFQDVRAFVADLVLHLINVEEERRGIVDALSQMIELRRQEMAELDDELARWSIGHEESSFRYGEVVDLTEPPRGFWYVYHLCHPSGRPFYVGKGIGNRMYQHVKEAVKGNGHNSYKCGVIRKLLKRGDQVKYRVVFITPDESEAYQYEVQEIARLGGYKKLTNLTLGGFTREHHDQAFGSNVPREQLSYGQFQQRLRLRPEITAEERQKYTRSWAEDRIFALRRLRRDAESLSHYGAIQKIDAEIDILSGHAAQQLSFVHLEKPRDRPYSVWSKEYYGCE